MKPHIVLAASLAIALFAPAIAADKTSPESLDRSIMSGLRSCFKLAERGAAKDNLLVAPALKNCYYQANQAWQVAASLVKDTLNKNPNSPSGRAIESIEQEWNNYSARVLSLESLRDMAINTDDGLELSMRKHFYELAYSLSVNPDCPR